MNCFGDLSNYKIYLRPGITDMRKSILTLGILVENQMKLDTLDSGLFVFCSRSRKIIKALYWYRNGFCLWQKKLAKHKFPWPKDEVAVREISQKELEQLLSGIAFFETHEELKFSSITQK